MAYGTLNFDSSLIEMCQVVTNLTIETRICNVEPTSINDIGRVLQQKLVFDLDSSIYWFFTKAAFPDVNLSGMRSNRPKY